MVTRKRLRSVLTALGLYAMAALLIGYFGVNAFNGDRGLKAQQDIDQQIIALTGEIDQLKRERAQWQRRVGLLKGDNLDPDMLDERARGLLDYAAPNDLTLMSVWLSGTAPVHTAQTAAQTAAKTAAQAATAKP
jgi:cell division protein FtsB